MYTVDLVQLIDKMSLENCTPDIDIKKIKISQPDVNRPALQLAGFFDHFDSERVQIIGYVENAYMMNVNKSERMKIMSRLMDYKVPCIVFCRNMEVSKELIELATEKEVPIFRSSKTTSAFMAEVIRWLNVELAPRISIHGVLVDVYGEGILIMGESGIGKSEAALELIKRGHRLVADDVVEIKKVSDETLIGTSPDITRHFIELRGIGIIDVKTLFGVESVKNTQSIDLVINLQEWSKDKEYDRFGLDEQYIEFLGNQVVCHSIPIRPGRNLAVICESAAVNHRQKKMGYNAAQELYNRVTNKIRKASEQ
ncbi:MAG: HPr(Ser) kinase/phosphatase [Clostridiales bacterium]|nr:HPr(Ser) kinase/phosphatase [Clostridiales bacterium]